MISMPDSFYLLDKVMVVNKDTDASQKAYGCLSLEGSSLLDIPTRNAQPIYVKEEGTLLVLNGTEPQPLEEPSWSYYYSLIEIKNEDIFGLSIRLGSAGIVASDAVVVNSAAVGSAASVFYGSLTIGERMPITRFYDLPDTWKPRALTQNLEQLTRYRCRQVLLDFNHYAKEIIKRKEITVTETRVRDWQAIEDSNWKQCILEITIKAESHIALRVWDELAEELQEFINKQPEIVRPFIEDKLSLDIKWVVSG